MQGNDYELEIDEIDEVKSNRSKTSGEDMDDELLRAVAQKDKKSEDQGEIILEASNYGISAFHPDIMFENLVNNYSMAKKVFGDTLIRLVSGYSEEYLKRNIAIPEFKRELKKKLEETEKKLKDDKLIKNDGTFTKKGMQLSSLVMYTQELDKILPKEGFGEKTRKKASHYGERAFVKNFSRGDRYKDIDLRQSLRLAIRRGQKDIRIDDLKSSKRESRGECQIVYAIDASGSMKGKKIEMCKKAGVALSYRAIEAKDKVGLIIFGSEVKEEIAPTDDFLMLLNEIANVKASKQTDFKEMMHKAIELFPKGDYTKHLIILTDAMPTSGKNPREESLKQALKIRDAGITISIIGINLDSEGEDFAEKLASTGEGKLYLIREVENLDQLVLEDYSHIRE